MMRKTAWFLIFTLSLMMFLLPKKKDAKRDQPSAQKVKVMKEEATPIEHQVKVIHSAPLLRKEIITLLDENELDKEESQKLAGLPRGMYFLPQVKAIPTEIYNLNLGPALMVKNHLTYYRNKVGQNDKSANVVYDKRRNTFHPISSTLKLSGVNPEQKEKIIQGKNEEHYYNEELQVLYLTSSNTDLLEDFKLLTEEGLPVAFEVIQDVYRTK